MLTRSVNKGTGAPRWSMDEDIAGISSKNQTIGPMTRWSIGEEVSHADVKDEKNADLA
jgi:hypothetical protein